MRVGFLPVAAMVALWVGGGALTAQTPWTMPAGQATMKLWPGGAPGASAAVGPEKDIADPKTAMTAGKPLVRLTNVSEPSLTLYAAKGTNSGAAVVVFPGGSYEFLAIDLEGTETCDWLTAQGVNCVLVKYRVPGSGPYPKSSAALQDAQRAVSLVRQHAVEWKLDPQKIGVIGYSAGGNLVAFLSTKFEQRVYSAVDAADEVSCRPDFAMMIYPAYLVDPNNGFAMTMDVVPTAQTPPAFIVQSENDPLHVENATAYFLALKNVKVPVEMHLFAKGGHGYGLRKTAQPVTDWPELANVWLQSIGVLKK